MPHTTPEIMTYQLLGYDVQIEIFPDNETLSNVFRQRGAYSKNDLEIMSRILKPGHVFVDAGANIGWHTIFGAKMVGPTGKVLAFEPEPKNAEWLRRNIELNRLTNVEVIEAALVDVPGERTLSKSKFNFGDHIVGLPFKTNAHETEVKIQCTTLDEVFKSRNIDPRAVGTMKIDVQGSEVALLNGGKELFGRHRPPLIMEYSPKHLRYLGYSFFDIFSFIDRYGYQPYHLNGDMLATSNQLIAPLSIENLLELTSRLFKSEFDEAIDLYLEPITKT